MTPPSRCSPATRMTPTASCSGLDVVGTDVSSATAGIPQGDVSFVVNLDFTDEGADKFFESTQKLAGQTFPNNAFAIVLDGNVVSYPTVNEPIPVARHKSPAHSPRPRLRRSPRC